MSDPIHDLTHDHADINRRVLALGSAVRTLGRDEGNGMARALVSRVGELRELLFMHFAQEEEGLFPFVTEALPELADQVQSLSVAHDAICGALARIYHLATANAEITTITAMFSRFEAAYASHAELEGEFLQAMNRRLDPAQREHLAALVRGL